MKKTFKLYGVLGKKYGTDHKFSTRVAGTVYEAVRMLEANFPGFKRDFKKYSYKIITDKGRLDHAQEACIEHNTSVYHIIPVVHAAANGKAIGSLIAGVAIVALAWWNPLGWASATQMIIGGIGVSTALTGAAALIAPVQDYDQSENPENRPSYIFRGGVNTVEQGNAIPIVYGEIKGIGATAISASIRIQDD